LPDGFSCENNAAVSPLPGGFGRAITLNTRATLLTYETFITQLPGDAGIQPRMKAVFSEEGLSAKGLKTVAHRGISLRVWELVTLCANPHEVQPGALNRKEGFLVSHSKNDLLHQSSV
jgi:hypothetical protein